MIAFRSCYRFVGCTSMKRISTTSQRCSIGLRIMEVIWVKWTHCHVQETSLRWFELCDGALSFHRLLAAVFLLTNRYFWHLRSFESFPETFRGKPQCFMGLHLPITNVWHQQPFHVQSHLNPLSSHSDARFELQQVVFTTFRCLNALSCCHVIGWLVFCVTKQLNLCT